MKHRRSGPIKPAALVHQRTKKPAASRVPPKNAATKAAAQAQTRSAPRPLNAWQAAREMTKGVRPQDVVILDIGAHYGNVTELMMRVWPRAMIYCFDPDPASLKRLHARFDDDYRVVVIPTALGSRRGEMNFHLCGQGTEMSSLLPRGDWMGRRYYRHTVKETIRVPVTTLDHFMTEHSIEQVHFAKMDVQGGEKLVLRGAKDALARGAIGLLYSEVLFASMYEGAYVFWELCRALENHGYGLFDIYQLQRSWISRQLKYGDAMWVSPLVRERILNRFPDEWLRKSLEHRMCPER